MFNVIVNQFLRTSNNEYRSCTALSKYVHSNAFINATVTRNNIFYNKYLAAVLELSARYTGKSIFGPGYRSLRVTTNLTSQYCQFGNCCNGPFWQIFDVRFIWDFIKMDKLFFNKAQDTKQHVSFAASFTTKQNHKSPQVIANFRLITKTDIQPAFR